MGAEMPLYMMTIKLESGAIITITEKSREIIDEKTIITLIVVFVNGANKITDSVVLVTDSESLLVA